LVVETCKVVTTLGGGGEAGLVDVLVDGGGERCQRAADFDGCGWLVGVWERPEEPVLELGVEHRDADAFGVRA